MNKSNQFYIYRVPTEILSTMKSTGPQSKSDLLSGEADQSSDEDSQQSEIDGDDDFELKRLNEISLKGDELTDAVRTNIGSPVQWYTSSLIPAPTKLGIYKTMLPSPDSSLRSIQIEPSAHSEPNGHQDRTIAMFMVGGGHFQGTIISLPESSINNCEIKASKGFHRYTTRRKQGGGQSANDNAKGAANSAGAQIRRYNEVALAEDIRTLLHGWRSYLAQAEVILVRASGQASRKLLYDNGLDKSDSRVRRFPLNTRRATQAEIIRCFHILTRVQFGSTEEDKVEQRSISQMPVNLTKKTAEIVVDPTLLLHSEKICTLIKKDKGPALRDYLRSNDIDVPAYRLEPRKAFIHTPTLLHYASANGSRVSIGELLDCGADPTIMNQAKKTPFETASCKATRDAFRIWRAKEDHEVRWDWEVARVPIGLTEDQIRARQMQEEALKAAEAEAEEERRSAELKRLEKEADDVRETEKKHAELKRGPGRPVAAGVLALPSSANLVGLTPEMRRNVEREQRARAAIARFAKN